MAVTEHTTVFISYASEDHSSARRIARSLEGLEFIRVWLDKANLLAGDEWSKELEDAIAESRFFLVVVTEVWLRKEGVAKRELEHALALHDERSWPKILPLRLKRCPIENMPIDRFHCIDMFPDFDRGMLEVRRSIWRHLDVQVHEAVKPLRVTSVRRSQYLEDWKREFGDIVLSTAPQVVIDALSELGDDLEEHVSALRVIVDLAHERGAASLPEYAFRSLELAQKCGTIGYLEQFYGVFLIAATRLSPRIREALIEKGWRRLSEQMKFVFRETFWAEIVLRDLAKHRMSWEHTPALRGVNIRGAPIVEREDLAFTTTKDFLELARWDAPIIDLLVFYARKVGDPRPLYSALRLASIGLCEERNSGHATMLGQLDKLILSLPHSCETSVADRLKPRLGYRLTPPLGAELPQWSGIKDGHTGRGEVDRLGMLLRIGDALTGLGEPSGDRLLTLALGELTSEAPGVSRAILQLANRERQELFNAIELLDVDTISFFLPNPEEAKRVRRFVTQGAYCTDPTGGGLVYPKLPPGVFWVSEQGTS